MRNCAFHFNMQCGWLVVGSGRRRCDNSSSTNNDNDKQNNVVSKVHIKDIHFSNCPKNSSVKTMTICLSFWQDFGKNPSQKNSPMKKGAKLTRNVQNYRGTASSVKTMSVVHSVTSES